MTPQKILDEWTKSGLLPGASLLVRKGKEVLLEYTSGYANVAERSMVKPDHIWVAASLAKPVATTALMQLVDQRQVRLDQSVRELLPEFPYESVLVRHLVTHASGLGPMEPEPGIIDSIGRIPAIAAGGLLFEPGTKCSYSTPAFDLVEAIVCRCSDKSWDEYTRRNIFQPLGMNNTVYCPPPEWQNRIAVVYDEADRIDPWWNDRDLRSIGLAGGGLFSTPGDLAAFCFAFLENGRPLISSESASQMTALQTNGLLNLEGNPQTWGLGWYLNQDGGAGFGALSRRAFGHGGITGTWMCVDPERELIVVNLANRLHIPLEQSIRMQQRLLHAIDRI